MTGRYGVGIDVGSTTVSAAMVRVTEQERPALSTLPLSDRAETMPSVVLVDEGGHLLAGEAARRGGPHPPGRRTHLDLDAVGDDVPLVVAGQAVPAARVFALLVAAAVEAATQQRGAAPDAIAVAHPAAWGPHRLDAVRSALAEAGVPEAILLPEPVAAATEHDHTSPVRAGESLAVYDLGGRGLRCAVVRKMADGFALVGESATRADLGGIDFDDIVVRHVRDCLPTEAPAAAPADVPEDPAAEAEAWALLRGECVEAKEELSADSRATIPVRLPGQDTSVRLTRAEFEQLVEPTLARSVATLQATLDAVDEPVATVVMVGGSARIPRAMQCLSESLDRHVAPGAHPGSAVARGAALAGLAALSPTPVTEDPEDAPPAADPGRPRRSAGHRPFWVRWAAVAGVSTAILVAIVLVANTLVGLPSVGAARGPDGTPSREVAAAPTGVAFLDDLIRAVARSTAPADPTDEQPVAPGNPLADRRADPADPGQTGLPAPAPGVSPEAPAQGGLPLADQPGATNPPGTTAPGTVPPATTPPATTPPATTPPATTPPATTPPATTPPATTPPATTPPATTPPATTPPTTDPEPSTPPATTAPPPSQDPVASPDPGAPVGPGGEV